jgi:hypothetical protein
MYRYVKKYLLAAAMVAFVAGCDAGITDIIKPDLPVQTGLRVDGYVDPLVEGANKGLTAFAEYNIGPDKNVTAQAVWTSSIPSVATVATGMLSAVSSGSSQITASYGGFTATVQVVVNAKPVVTVSLAGQDTLVQAFIRTSVAHTDGRIVKFDSTRTIKVQVPEGLLSSADSIFAFWRDLWGYNFQAVTDSAGADIVTDVTDVGVQEGKCGFGSPILYESGLILKSRIVLRPGSCSTGLVGILGFTHELGHALGLQAHTPVVSPVEWDIMKAAPMVIRSSPTLQKIVKFYRASPAGALVVEG